MFIGVSMDMVLGVSVDEDVSGCLCVVGRLVWRVFKSESLSQPLECSSTSSSLLSLDSGQPLSLGCKNSGRTTPTIA